MPKKKQRNDSELVTRVLDHQCAWVRGVCEGLATGYLIALGLPGEHAAIAAGIAEDGRRRFGARFDEALEERGLKN
jgi:hypothetical protein